MPGPESGSFMNGGATVWCDDGHDPKLINGDGEVQTCPECGMAYRVELEVTPLEVLEE